MIANRSYTIRDDDLRDGITVYETVITNDIHVTGESDAFKLLTHVS